MPSELEPINFAAIRAPDEQLMREALKALKSIQSLASNALEGEYATDGEEIEFIARAAITKLEQRLLNE